MNQLYSTKRNMYIERVLTSLGLIVAVLAFLIAPPVQVARAAAMTNLSDTLSTLKQNTKADHTILFRLSSGGNGLASGETIILTFDTDIDVTTGLEFGDIDLSYDPTPDSDCTAGESEMTLDTSPSGTTMGVVRTDGQIITFTNGSQVITAGSDICIQIGLNAAGSPDEQIRNAVTAASDNLVITGTIGAGDPETGTMVITSVADDIVVTTATVVASLTFTVDDNDIFFGTLGTGAAKWADNTSDGSTSSAVGHTMTVGTNSTAGYSVTYNGTTLTSGSDTIDVATWTGDPDGTPGSEQFAIAVTVSDNATIPTAYQQASNNFSFVASTATTLVSETVQTATETISVYYIANIASDTEAHTDYTSNITYIATGNF